MSTSPTAAAAVPSTKRPLEDPSSPTPQDLPDAKRPALDKVIKDGNEAAVRANVEHSVADGTTADDIKTASAPVANGSSAAHAIPVVADVPNGTAQIAAISLETQPIQSTASHNERAASHPPSNVPLQDETNWIHVRSVISSAEAATCIGKGGENVSQIRRLSNAKCTVSDYSRGAVERILTVSGQQDAVAKVGSSIQ